MLLEQHNGAKTFNAVIADQGLKYYARESCLNHPFVLWWHGCGRVVLFSLTNPFTSQWLRHVWELALMLQIGRDSGIFGRIEKWMFPGFHVQALMEFSSVKLMKWVITSAYINLCTSGECVGMGISMSAGVCADIMSSYVYGWVQVTAQIQVKGQLEWVSLIFPP